MELLKINIIIFAQNRQIVKTGLTCINGNRQMQPGKRLKE